MTKDFLVFDLESQRSAEEVGGWENIAEMKMSVGVVWDSKAQKFFVYFEDQVQNLVDHLTSGARVIGYNHLNFDYTVLSGYYELGLEREKIMDKLLSLNNLDLLHDLKNRIGRRIRLDTVARPTLKVGKSADGLQAIQWYKEYLEGEENKIHLIADYCKQDVSVTRDVYLYGLSHKEVLYYDYNRGVTTVQVDWEDKTGGPAEDDSVQLSF